jgi:hypothetical protein
MSTAPSFGYALSFNTDTQGWSYRAVAEGFELTDDETFYTSTDDFPQAAKDWFAAHPFG